MVMAAGITGAAEEEAARTFKIYSLFDADPEAAQETISHILHADSSMVLDKNRLRLLIMATPREHEKIEAVMREIALPPANVRIDVRFAEKSRRREREASAEGQGTWEFGPGGKKTFKIKPKVIDQLTKETAETTQILMAASGREGRLHIGEDVPYLDWFAEYGRRWGYIESEIQWRKVGSYLIVKPTVIGDGPYVRIQIIPELSGLVDGNPYRVRFQRASTEVTVRSGETVRIGGSAENNDFYSRFLVGVQDIEDRSTLDIELTPTIQHLE